MKLVLCVALGLVTPGFCVGQASSPSEQSLASNSERVAFDSRGYANRDRTQSEHATFACRTTNTVRDCGAGSETGGAQSD